MCWAGLRRTRRCRPGVRRSASRWPCTHWSGTRWGWGPAAGCFARRRRSGDARSETPRAVPCQGSPRDSVMEVFTRIMNRRCRDFNRGPKFILISLVFASCPRTPHGCASSRPLRLVSTVSVSDLVLPTGQVRCETALRWAVSPARLRMTLGLWEGGGSRGPRAVPVPPHRVPPRVLPERCVTADADGPFRVPSSPPPAPSAW